MGKKTEAERVLKVVEKVGIGQQIVDIKKGDDKFGKNKN